MNNDLREAVRDAINDVFRRMNCRGMVPTRAASGQAADAVLAVFVEHERNSHTQWVSKEALPGLFAERERELRARIEALHEPYKRDDYVIGHNEALDRVLAAFDEAVPDEVDKPVCASCGDLSWTVSRYGRVTHKEACRFRTDPWSQSYPRRGDDDEAVSDGE